MLDDYVIAQINGIKTLVDYEKLSAEEKAEVDKKLFELRNQLQDAYYQQTDEKRNVDLEKTALHHLERTQHQCLALRPTSLV